MAVSWWPAPITARAPAGSTPRWCRCTWASAVAAKSFARIHQANLINNGILPLTFANEADYDKISQGDELCLPGVRAAIEAGKEALELRNETKQESYTVLLPLTERQRGMILSGGLINFIRTNG